MTRTITRLFDSHTEALDAVEDLEQAGVDRDRISLVSNNADNWHGGDWRGSCRGVIVFSCRYWALRRRFRICGGSFPCWAAPIRTC